MEAFSDADTSRLPALRSNLSGVEFAKIPGHWRLRTPAWTVSPSDAAGHATLKRDQYETFLKVMSSQFEADQVARLEWMKPAFVCAVSDRQFSSSVRRDRVYNLMTPATLAPSVMASFLATRSLLGAAVRFFGVPGTPPSDQEAAPVLQTLEKTVPLSSEPLAVARDGQLTGEAVRGPVGAQTWNLDITGLDSLADRAYVENEFLFEAKGHSILDFFKTEDEFQAGRPLYNRLKEPNPPRDFQNLAPVCYFVEFPAKVFSEAAGKHLPIMSTTSWRWQPTQIIASWKVQSGTTLRGAALNDEVSRFLDSLAGAGLAVQGGVSVAVATQNPLFRALGLRQPRLIAEIRASDANALPPNAAT